MTEKSELSYSSILLNNLAKLINRKMFVKYLPTLQSKAHLAQHRENFGSSVPDGF